MSDLIEELPGSELGTKEYWEQSYHREIQNYRDHGDVGEVWFDEDSQIRIVNWMLKSDSIENDSKIVDLGSGNGMLLVELAREGYTNLLGVDYSPKAIELSTDIAKDQQLSIEYKVVDLLDGNAVESLGNFKVVHDKGTYDAVSLIPEDTKNKREIYIENVRKLLEPDGYFIITSCNWTEFELNKSFENKFIKHCTIPTPTFKFGGVIGNVVTSLVYKKCT